MTNSIQAMREKLLNEKNKTENRGQTRTSSGDNASFPFWDTPTGQSTLVRFLPDADPTNDYFWQKREVIKLPFAGVVGGDYPTDKPVTVTVPCVDMFGMSCPIIAETRSWWDDERKKDLARTYYKKRSYIFNGFVVNSPIQEKSVPENPIRKFVINKSIYNIIFEAILDPEMADLPTDFVGGRDFTIKKTQNGQYANYGTSKFSMNPRSLTEDQLAAIDQFGLHNLRESLGAIPTADHMEAIKAMFRESLAGQPYDAAQFGQYYRPYADNNGGGNGGGGYSAAATEQTVQRVVETVKDSSGGVDPAVEKAQAVLARLRANKPA